MNWKLKFKPSGTFVELYDKGGKVILSRAFSGWTRHIIATGDSGHILPKFQLEKNESVSQDSETGDLTVKNN